MKVIAIGGSNTVYKRGYRSLLEQMLPDIEVINRAIGASNSLMGLYRLITCPDLNRGDVVMWEYALNDSFGVPSRGEVWLLSVVERTIRYAQSRSCMFLPLIFTPMGKERGATITPHRAMLHALFNSYGLTTIDASFDARREFDMPELDKADFENPSHYLPGGRIVEMVARNAAKSIKDRSRRSKLTPHKRPEMFCRPGFAPMVRTDFTGGDEATFKNSLVNIKYRDLRGGGDVVFSPDTPKGRVLGAITLVSPDAGKCIFDATGKQKTISMQPAANDVKMTLLKSVLGEKSLQRIGTGPGKTMSFTPTESVSDERPRGIVAMLTEEPV